MCSILHFNASRLTGLLLFLLCFFSATAQIVSIPDTNFKNYLVGRADINTNGNNEIELIEAEAFNDSIDCPGLEIADLMGIEAFENLRYLSCVDNNITALDLTGNPNLLELHCAYNPLISLNISAVPDLKVLYTDQTELATLNLLGNPALVLLSCKDNNLTSLNLSANTELLNLNCGNNMISSLDLSACPNLTYVSTNGNPISVLDLSANTQLEFAQFISNNLTDLNVVSCTALVHLDCAFNSLTTLDLSQNPNLEVIYCFANQLTSLNIANGNNTSIERLWTWTNDITCFQVDDPAYSTANWTGEDFMIDTPFVYSTGCFVGLEEQQQLEMTIYPNPASDDIHIAFEGNVGELIFSLTDLHSNSLATLAPESAEAVFDVSNLSSGIYFVEVSDRKSKRILSIQKVIKL